MAPRLVDVPAAVSQVAQAALVARAARQGGGTARGLVVATAMASGHCTTAELLEARDWHRRNVDEVREGRSSLLGGLYGGAPGRSWLLALDAATAAARNPEGRGAMIALPVSPSVAKALARDDGEPPAAFHLTLFHLSSDASTLPVDLRARYAEALRRVAGDAGAPTVNLSHYERFSPTDEGLEPVAAVADEPAVYALRQSIETMLRSDDLPFSDDHAFRAHVTVGYYPPGDGPDAGPLEEPQSLRPEALELHWGGDVERFGLTPAASATNAEPGYYVLQDGWPISGPHPDRATARGDLEPGDDGIVYLDGTVPGGVLARAGAAPPSRQLRRRRARMRRLQAAVDRIDRDLARRVQAAADAAMREALRKATATLRSRSRTRAQKDALVRSAGLATPAVLAALGLEEQRLVEHSFTGVADLFRRWAAQAERDKLAVAARELKPDPELGETDGDWSAVMLEGRFGPEVDRRAETAAGLLAAALGWHALRRLSRGVDAPRGEVAGEVPFRALRGPLALVRTGETPVVDLDGTRDGLPRSSLDGRRDSTSNVARLLQEREPGATRRGEWVHGYYGEPRTAFDPHDALGEIDWTEEPLDGPFDDRLAKDPGEFPEGSHYAPDDHDGCTCEIVDAYDVPVDVEGEAQPIAAALPIVPNTAPGLGMTAVERVLARREARG